ncbi:MAG: hypothetical protein KKF44_01775 [Nanoarchaeota archaeon]|nr:hypothetical protein [Nanoarchaeota archaeon]
MDTSEILFNIALLAFSISYSIYFQRLIKEWPLIGRWMRYLLNIRPLYQYSKLHSAIAVVTGFLVYNVLGITLFLSSINAFVRLRSFFYIGIVVYTYLILPSFLMHIVRGLLQLFIGKDYTKAKDYFDSQSDRSNFRLGLNPDTANEIYLDIKEKKYLRIAQRIIVCSIVIAICYLMPFVLVLIEKVRA